MVTSRREFLQIGMAATALPLTFGLASAGGIDRCPSLPIYTVIYDTRFAPSIDFARRSEALGLATRAIEGDVTAVWYHDIYHRWKTQPVAIAGLTGEPALFCFDQLGRDQRLRIVFRAEHRPVADGGVDHALNGPASMLAAASRLDAGARGFGRSMAEVIARCPSGRAEIASAGISGHGRLELARDVPALYSWILAPAVRA